MVGEEKKSSSFIFWSCVHYRQNCFFLFFWKLFLISTTVVSTRLQGCGREEVEQMLDAAEPLISGMWVEPRDWAEPSRAEPLMVMVMVIFFFFNGC